MGFDPVRTVVGEDAPRGVQAGVAAGMTVLALARRAPARELEAAGGDIFPDMHELPNLIAAP